MQGINTNWILIEFTSEQESALASILSAKSKLYKSIDLRNIIATISDKLQKNNIVAEIACRLKDPCSAVKKLLQKSVVVQELKDLIAFRIIVNTTAECYKVLHIIDNSYSVNVEKSKDFIVNPKYNGYRSLHGIIDIYERNIEIQIRSRSMHYAAEIGTARHDKYKKAQAAKLIGLFSHEILNKACINIKSTNSYNIGRQFNWTILDLLAYEKAIEHFCYNLHAMQLQADKMQLEKGS